MIPASEPVFDADQHYYEARDAFTRHLPQGWGPRTVQEAIVDGKVRHIVGGKINTTVSNPTFDPIVKPGAMVDYFRGNPEGKQLADCLAEREPIPSYYRDRDDRLRKMDEQDLRAIWLLPTLGMAYEEDLQYDPPACATAFRAFNGWLLDDWGFNYENRIFTSPYLTMSDPGSAVADVDWMLEQGARIIVVRPAATHTADGWRSPGDPVFDPIWARIAEAGVTVVPHVAEVGGSGLDRYLEYHTGVIASAAPPLQIAVGHERAIANYMGAVICDRLFERFPNLRFASVENGADFLRLLLPGLKRAGFQRPGYFRADPVETFKEHVWVAPFWEDDLREVVDVIGPERVLFGSDWPHPEGMAEPRHYDKIVAELEDPAAERLIMFENTTLLTGLDEVVLTGSTPAEAPADAG
jgi:predicted TIM-barrel fold metal-dependent hydrolase